MTLKNLETREMADRRIEMPERRLRKTARLLRIANPHSNGNAQSNGSTNGSSNGSSNGSKPAVAAHEWKVTRRLRVTAQGTYTSNYYINEEPCTVTQLHEQLQRFRIYPEGYNVVLQGDVTSIISMNARERREIIDELAGVASFDRKN